jgi:hypothetical protein
MGDAVTIPPVEVPTTADSGPHDASRSANRHTRAESWRSGMPFEIHQETLPDLVRHRIVRNIDRQQMVPSRAIGIHERETLHNIIGNMVNIGGAQ